MSVKMIISKSSRLFSKLILIILIYSFIKCDGDSGSNPPPPPPPPIIHEKDITSNEKWSNDNDHIIKGSITVKNATLTIEEGAVVQFERDKELIIDDGGGLIAGGRSTTTKFTGVEKSVGYWHFIKFTAESKDEKCQLINCTCEFGGGGGGSGDRSGIIVCESASPTIESCIIQFSASWGIYYDIESHPDLEGTTYSNNEKGDKVQTNEKLYEADIEKAETWSDEWIHIINSQIKITNATLKIKPGTTVKFAEDASLTIGDRGGLIADGESQKITFTGETEQKGWWNYIHFDKNSTDQDCKLINCEIKFGGIPGYHGMIRCTNSAPTIKNCKINHSATNGVYMNSESTPIFEGNIITENDGAPIVAAFKNASYIDNRGKYTGNAIDYILLEGNETLKNNAYWQKQQDVPYRLQGSNAIENSTLTIAPGTTIEMDDNAKLTVRVNGGLIADGTAEGQNDKITFTGAERQQGSWDYISFQAGASDDQCKLIYCNINYGGGDNNYPGMVQCYGSAPTIKNCEIKNSASYGVYLDAESTPDFSDNTITENDDAPICADFKSACYIEVGDYTGNLKDYVLLEHRQSISSEATWHKLNVPYRVTGKNNIEGGTLTIEAGTTIQMDEKAAIDINAGAGLIADGASERITITGTQTTKGWWSYICFNENSNSNNCLLNYCILEWGGRKVNPNYNAIIISHNCSPKITNCWIQHSKSYGIYYDGESSPILLGNSLSDNDDGDIGHP